MKTPRPLHAAPAGSSDARADQGPIDWSCALQENSVWLRRVLRCRVGDAHAVDDLIQEIALAVFRQASRPTDPAKVAPWLYRLAIRYAINYHRRSGRQKNLLKRAQSRADAAWAGDSGDVLDWMIQDEQQELFRQALKELRAQDREILILKYTENWTYGQLARKLGATVHTVEYRLLRAKRRLRSLLNRQRVHEAIR